jgi:hypothetical protein
LPCYSKSCYALTHIHCTYHCSFSLTRTVILCLVALQIEGTSVAQTWIKTGAPNLGWGAIASSADGMKLVATALGPIYASTNAGASWNLTTAPPSRWSSVAGSADGATWVAATFYDSGDSATIYRSTDSGMNWLELTNARGSSWAALATEATAAATPPPCPKCDGAMVLRTAKTGANQGGKFWGCSNFRDVGRC